MREHVLHYIHDLHIFLLIYSASVLCTCINHLKSCLSCFASEPSYLHCPSNILISNLVNPRHSQQKSSTLPPSALLLSCYLVNVTVHTTQLLLIPTGTLPFHSSPLTPPCTLFSTKLPIALDS